MPSTTFPNTQCCKCEIENFVGQGSKKWNPVLRSFQITHLSVKPAGLSSAEEELTSVGVGSGIGHGQDTRPGVLQLKVLIGKLVSVDGLSSGTVVVGEVSSLAQESMVE